VEEIYSKDYKRTVKIIGGPRSNYPDFEIGDNEDSLS